METQGKKLAIVGGGAAGLAAAIAAGERAVEQGMPLSVVVYERDDRVGRSILATGNGRCNFSNSCLQVDEYRNAEFVSEALKTLHLQFSSDERSRKAVRNNGSPVHAFFYQHGLMWRSEDDGRQYPHTNKATTVLDVLRASAARLGVREACEQGVSAIDPPHGEGKPFTLRMQDGVLERADAVIVACGGRALESLDMSRCPDMRMLAQKPLLGPLRVAGPFIPIVRELDNIRVRCLVSLVRPDRKDGQPHTVASERGELLFRKYGVSGICVFNLSRFVEPGDELRINFLEMPEPEDAKTFLFTRRKLLAEQFQNLTCEDMMRGLVLPRVSEAVLKQAGLKPKSPFSKAAVSALAEALTSFALVVEGIGDESICQVRRGGLDVGAFDPGTMGAYSTPGLYAVGEALDVDGPCGGYNLHWAWSSGLLAGRCAVDGLLRDC